MIEVILSVLYMQISHELKKYFRVDISRSERVRPVSKMFYYIMALTRFYYYFMYLLKISSNWLLIFPMIVNTYLLLCSVKIIISRYNYPYVTFIDNGLMLYNPVTSEILSHNGNYETLPNIYKFHIIMFFNQCMELIFVSQGYNVFHEIYPVKTISTLVLISFWLYTVIAVSNPLLKPTISKICNYFIIKVKLRQMKICIVRTNEPCMICLENDKKLFYQFKCAHTSHVKCCNKWWEVSGKVDCPIGCGEYIK